LFHFPLHVLHVAWIDRSGVYLHEYFVSSRGCVG
jgi:hypothetical protein